MWEKQIFDLELNSPIFTVGAMALEDIDRALDLLKELENTLPTLPHIRSVLDLTYEDMLLTCYVMEKIFTQGTPITTQQYLQLNKKLKLPESSPLPATLYWSNRGIAISQVCRDFLLMREPQLPEGVELMIPSEGSVYHNEDIIEEIGQFINYYLTKPQLTATVALQSPKSTGKKFILSKAAESLGSSLLLINHNSSLNYGEITLAASLYNALVCFVDYSEKSSGKLKELQKHLGIMLITTTEDCKVVGDIVLKRKLKPIAPNQIENMINSHIKDISPTTLKEISKLPLTVDTLMSALPQLIWETSKKSLTDDMVKSIIARENKPDFAGTATPLITGKKLSDIILPNEQWESLKNICDFARNQHIVYDNWGFKEKIPYGRGITALFYGASGTGKTLAATALANEIGKPIYRVDLSQLTSKYVGETQKNIGKIFDTAQIGDCILFFDEADALFSRRTDNNDAQDKHANGEIAYLLQKTEEYEGITILATNLLQSFDEAFRRRINFMIRFPMPNEELRLKLWQNIFPTNAPLEEVDMEFLAKEFELSGAGIKNASVNAALLAASKSGVISMAEIISAIKWEYHKLGKHMDPRIITMYGSGE